MTWRAAVNGSGARPWFVVRGEGSAMAVLFGKNGVYRRFKTGQAAKRVAALLNL